MAKSKTPSYTLTLELKVYKKDRIAIDKINKIAIQMYNDCLNEALTRLHRLQSDKQYNELKKELRTISKNLKDKRKEDERYQEICDSLNEIAASYAFTENDLQKYIKISREYFKNVIGSTEAQKIASRAFKAVDKIRLGKTKRVNFKSPTFDTISIENKSNTSGLRYKDGFVLWNNLKLAPIIEKNDTYAQLAIQDKTKYVRILIKTIRGRKRYFVQLIQEGVPPIKKEFKSESKSKTKSKTKTKKIGLDIGPSTIAIVSDNFVNLRELAPHAEIDAKEIYKLQRKLDRSRRATNPNNYNNNGAVKKGKRNWTKSNTYIKTEAKLKELYRKASAKRTESHNKLANEIVNMGTKIYIEDMNFKSLQKRSKQTTRNKSNGKINKKTRFGKSIGNHAPLMFVEILKRKLKYKGIKLNVINTASVKASQYNHDTDTYNKKELSDRWMMIGNKEIQRDLYSAFLIKNVKANFKEVNRKKCIKEFNDFVKLHDIVIKDLEKIDSKAIKNVIKRNKQQKIAD